MFKLNTEINYIKNSNYKKDLITLLDLLPDYFYHIPASSTGKYHPSFSLGEGGLLRHTKAAVKIAYDLLNNEAIGHSFTSDEKDLMIIALILHDGLKHGKEKQEFVIFDHPLEVVKLIKENKSKLSLNEEDLEILTTSIASHMGNWNTNSYSDIVLPVPKNKYQRFVHMCDYLASRKYLDIKFKNDEIEE